MDTKHSINRKFNRMFAIILSIVVVLSLAFPGMGVVLAQDEPPPDPFIAVSLTEHWFWVNNFTPETLVTFSIYDNQGNKDPMLEFSRPTDTSGNLTIAGWEHTWDPEHGDYIVASDGVIIKDLVLEYVTLEIFDYENNLISGKALFGRKVDIGVGNANGEQWMTVFAEEASGDETIGIWTADFNALFDITDDMWAGAHVNDDDGDVTAAHNSGPPEPPAWFTAFPSQDAVEGWDFPMGAVVHLTIDDPMTETFPDYQQDETVTFTPWGSWQLWVWFDLAGMYDIKAGDIVTLSYGNTVRTHTVQNLSVTKVVHEDDTVKGSADAGVEVHVWPYATGQDQLAIAKTKGKAKGKWNVDFSGIFDLAPGECGRSEIYDQFGNRTAVDWCVP